MAEGWHNDVISKIEAIHVQHDSARYTRRSARLAETKGTPVPTNDIWIAATALQKGLPLFTLDQHFQRIAGLLLI
ncbi:MAG: PIN domain-containing protein [Methylococcales bacterium]